LTIGAARGRLIRQTLTESLVLVGAGSALGMVVARLGEQALAAFFAEGNNKIILDLSMNPRVLLFTLTVSLLTGLAFGLLPALRATRVDPAAALQGGSRSFAGSRASLRLNRGLVILQVALSLALLTSAGVFIHSLNKLETMDPGFTRDGILTMEVTPEFSSWGKPDWFGLQTELIARVRRMPGVLSAGWSTMTPLSGRDRGVILDVPGFVPRAETDRDIRLISVSPEYYATLGMPLLRGRAFAGSDGGSSPKVAILNETAARFYFGGAPAVGRKLRFAHQAAKGDGDREIVGVVQDAKHKGLREEPQRAIFIPVEQAIDRINRLALSVRCSGDPLALAMPVRKVIQDARSSLLITNVSTMERQVQLSLIRERLVSALSTTFGVVALVLACIGLYGILAYAVTRRTSEIGIRMALGATTGGMVWLILRDAVALAVGGIALGVPAVLAVGGVSRALLYGVEPFDIPALGCAVLVLLVSAALAGVVPARRAGRLDPMGALRCE
jgi:predicted permease